MYIYICIYTCRDHQYRGRCSTAHDLDALPDLGTLTFRMNTIPETYAGLT